jgi:hypothetical protein
MFWKLGLFPSSDEGTLPGRWTKFTNPVILSAKDLHKAINRKHPRMLTRRVITFHDKALSLHCWGHAALHERESVGRYRTESGPANVWIPRVWATQREHWGTSRPQRYCASRWTSYLASMGWLSCNPQRLFLTTSISSPQSSYNSSSSCRALQENAVESLSFSCLEIWQTSWLWIGPSRGLYRTTHAQKKHMYPRPGRAYTHDQNTGKIQRTFETEQPVKSICSSFA